MATNPVTGKKMVVETLLDFVNYNENSEAEIGEGTFFGYARSQNSKKFRFFYF